MREIQLYKRAVSCQTCGWLRTARSYATCKFTEEIAIVPQAFNPPDVVQPFGIFSSAAWQAEGRVLHLSGQVAQAADGSAVGIGDIEAQTRQVLDNLARVLASVGGPPRRHCQSDSFCHGYSPSRPDPPRASRVLHAALSGQYPRRGQPTGTARVPY